MANCEIKKGVFIQRVCGSPSYHYCSVCNTSVCSKHSRPVDDSNNGVLCLNCYLDKEKITEDQARQHYLDSDDQFMLWYSSFRVEHAGSRRQLMFDESDYQGFDNQHADEQVYLDDDGDFFDS